MSQLPRHEPRTAPADRLFAYLSEHGPTLAATLREACNIMSPSKAAQIANCRLANAGDPRRVINRGDTWCSEWLITQPAQCNVCGFIHPEHFTPEQIDRLHQHPAVDVRAP